MHVGHLRYGRKDTITGFSTLRSSGSTSGAAGCGKAPACVDRSLLIGLVAGAFDGAVHQLLRELLVVKVRLPGNGRHNLPGARA
jgi:hypothetical protein